MAKRPASAGIIFHNGKGKVIAMPRVREETGKRENGYDIPKGNVDKGETPLQAAVRETREEIGISVKPKDLTSLLVYKGFGSQKKDLYLFQKRVKDIDKMKRKNIKIKNVRDGDWYYNLKKVMKLVAKKIS